jgi:hypothetical protein
VRDDASLLHAVCRNRQRVLIFKSGNALRQSAAILAVLGPDTTSCETRESPCDPHGMRDVAKGLGRSGEAEAQLVTWKGRAVRGIDLISDVLGVSRWTSPAGTSEPKTHYSYVLWDGTSPSVPKGIAVFAPEYMDTSVVATYFPSS